MISVLLFDVGDTLLDASSGHQDALQEAQRTALAKFGFELSAGEYQQLDHEKMLQFVPSAMHSITWHFARPDVCLFNEITEEVRSHYPQIRALGFRCIPESQQSSNSWQGNTRLCSPATPRQTSPRSWTTWVCCAGFATGRCREA